MWCYSCGALRLQLKRYCAAPNFCAPVTRNVCAPISRPTAQPTLATALCSLLLFLLSAAVRLLLSRGMPRSMRHPFVERLHLSWAGPWRTHNKTGFSRVFLQGESRPFLKLHRLGSSHVSRAPRSCLRTPTGTVSNRDRYLYRPCGGCSWPQQRAPSCRLRTGNVASRTCMRCPRPRWT